MNIKQFFHTNAELYLFILFSIVIVIIIGSIYINGNLMADNFLSEIKNTTLEKTSCEQMFNINNNMSNRSYNLFYDTKNIIKQVKIKWEEMKCNDVNSEYWRGADWQWSDSIENKIKGFNNGI